MKDKKNKFHFLVADLYSEMSNVFRCAEAREFDDEDYYWWADYFVCRIIKNFQEGKEILEEVMEEGGAQ